MPIPPEVFSIVGHVHRHYKGGRYLVQCLAETHNHNGDIDVVYISLTYGKAVTRPFQRDSRNEDAWTDTVTWPDGKVRARFVKESILDKDTLTTCFGEFATSTREEVIKELEDTLERARSDAFDRDRETT